MRANKPHIKNEANDNLKTESTENTANAKIYSAIFRIWTAVLGAKGEFPLPMQPNILLA